MDEERLRGLREAAVAEDDAAWADVLEVHMGGKVFLLPASDVTEVVRPIPLTPAPMAPDHLLGLGNIHGQIVCVIEPCRMLNLPRLPREDDEFTRLVCLRHPRMRVAMRVDAVPAIHRVPEERLPARDPGCMDDVYGRLTLEVGGVSREYPLLNTAALLHE